MNQSESDSIKKLIKIHNDSHSIDFEELWREGVFIFDANVLLDLYRLPVSAQKDLIDVLKNKEFNKRIWISFQALLEFLSNRHDALGDQKSKFEQVRRLLTESRTQYLEIFSKLSTSLSALKLKQRHSLIDPDKHINEGTITSGISFIDNFINSLSDLEPAQPSVTDADRIKDTVLEVFESKTGESLSNEELKFIYSEGERRYKDKIPPGYKDSDKTGSYFVGKNEYKRKFGDLILWQEIIKKAKKDKLKYIIFVTGDVKEDWWLEKSGKKLGPRKELLNEIYEAAPSLKAFYLYDTSRFLSHAREKLHVTIQESSIDETRRLIQRNRLTTENEFYATDIAQIINAVLTDFEYIDFSISGTIINLPPANINPNSFHSAIVEIASNIHDHAEDMQVSIDALAARDGVAIAFRNKIDQNKTSNWAKSSSETISKISGRGIDNIKYMLKQDGLSVLTHKYYGEFIITLIIPNSKFPYDPQNEEV